MIKLGQNKGHKFFFSRAQVADEIRIGCVGKFVFSRAKGADEIKIRCVEKCVKKFVTHLCLEHSSGTMMKRQRIEANARLLEPHSDARPC